MRIGIIGTDTIHRQRIKDPQQALPCILTDNQIGEIADTLCDA